MEWMPLDTGRQMAAIPTEDTPQRTVLVYTPKVPDATVPGWVGTTRTESR